VDLLELLKRPEGKTLEYKRGLSSPEGAMKIHRVRECGWGRSRLGSRTRRGARSGSRMF